MSDIRSADPAACAANDFSEDVPSVLTQHPQSMIERTPYHSWKTNQFAKGCVDCVSGRKLVVFITGVCPRHCFYCPISDQKKDRDVVYANERPIHEHSKRPVDAGSLIRALIEEATACQATGAGFTGGDPLTRNDRTCIAIKALKEHFGRKFHIHLYTIPESLTDDRLQKLDDAGLDEIRLHPDFESEAQWDNIERLFDEKGNRKYSFNIGIEIPAIPGQEKRAIQMLDRYAGRMDFVNLNELEISDTNGCALVDKGHVPKDRTSYGVEGSAALARRLMKHLQQQFPKLNVHFCTCKLKDRVQLRERLKLRAMQTRRVFDIVTPDGTFTRGAIYLPESVPGFGYHEKVKSVAATENTPELFARLEQLRIELIEQYHIPKEYLEIDRQKYRIITNVGVAEKLANILKEKGFTPAIVEQYPTYDQMEVEVTFL